jgi:outer membrane lipoprotein-sorting protein
MGLLRTASTRRLLVLLAAVAALIAAAAVGAVAALGGAGSPPPPKPLAQALHDAAAAPKPAGVSGRVTFTNNLLPSTSGLGQAAPPLVAGGSGRIWLTNDGRGRVELQSDAGDAQIVWSKTQAAVYDASSNTVYRIALPAQTQQTAPKQGTPPTVAQITTLLQKLTQVATVSGPDPLVLARTQPAYSVRVTPKDASGLFDGGSVAWDASSGAPLQVAVYARGASSPVLALKVTQISYGAVPSSDVEVAPPAGAKVVDVTVPSHGSGSGTKQAPVTGLDAVQAKLPFTLVAPDALGARQRSEVRLVGKDSALLVYGHGLGSVAVLESQPKQGGGTGQLPGLLAALPKVTVGSASATELSTPLGTVLRFEHGGLSFVVGGSLPSGEVQGAAAALAS